MEPIRPAGRIPALDALRGLAVLGILIVNAPFFAAPIYQAFYLAIWPFPENPASLVVWAGTQVFFSSKFISLFSMLFGVSLYLMGGETSDAARNLLLTRRLVWLLAFGLVHGLLVWSGDILFAYAICGLVLAPLRSLSAGRLLVLGGLAYGLYAAFTLVNAAHDAGLGVAGTFDPDFPHQAGFLGGFGDSLRANMLDWLKIGFEAEISVAFYTAPLMLIGLGLYKAGALGARKAYVPAIALAVVALVATAWLAQRQLASGFGPFWQVWSEALRHLLAPFVTLGYAAAILLAGKTVGFLVPVGRMAFSNYLAQSLVMTAIFYGGRGLDLFGQVDRPGLALIVLGVWAAQIAASHLWLRRFSMGPAEWLWRRLTYGRPIRM